MSKAHGRARIAEDGAVSDYAFLDCGGGRRLERFGPHLADRPAPAALVPPRLPPSAWAAADLRFEPGERGPGAWGRGADTAAWVVEVDGLRLELRPAAGGQLGLFPDHVATWARLRRLVADAARRLGRPPEVLSLFAYTGGASLACASAGARVAHVDASRPAVAWARRNATLSGLADRPVRWLVDDAAAFVRREIRRGHRYDGILLDPPSYGHGAGAWRIREDLPALLDDLARVADPRGFGLLTTHTPGLDGEALARLVRERFGAAATHDALELRSPEGAVLRAGSAAWWGRL